MAVGVNIVSNFDGKGISKAIKEFKKLDGGAAKSAFALGTLDKSATAAVKGLSKVAAGIGVAAGVIGYSLVKASIQAQAEQDRLRQILLTTNGATDAQVTALIAQAEALEKVGVASAGSIITAQSQLATFDLQYDTIKTLTPAITDYVIAEKGATATSEEFKSMTNGLAKALNGQFDTLTKSGFVLDEQTKKLISTGTEAERAAAIVDVLSSTYGGFNEAIADTPEGQMVQLMNSFQALRTELGTLLLPAFLAIADFLQTKLIPYLDNLADVIGDKGVGGAVQMLADDFLKMTGNMGKTGNIILGIVTAFVALKGAMMAYSIAQGIATIATTAFGVAWNATGIGLIAAAIAAIVIGLIALYIKFESVRKVVSALGDVLKFVVMNAIAGVQNYFISFINIAIMGFNALIKVANFFGADLKEQELLGYKAFTGLSIGADNATGKVLNVAEALQKVKNEERMLEGKGTGTPSTIPKNLGGAVSKTIKTLKELKKEYKDAALALNDAQVKMAESTQGIADAQQKVIDATNNVDDAFRGIAKAEREVTNKIKEHERAQRAVTDAMSDAADAVLDTQRAQDKLAKSTAAVTKAQQALDEALRGYGADSEQGRKAQDQLGESQRELETSGYDLEEAQFALIDAENELAAVRANSESTARDIRQAEIDLAVAKLDVIEAERDHKIAQDEATASGDNYNQMLNGVKTDSELYKELLDALNESKAAEQEAIDAVTEARKAEAEATAEITEALNAEQEALLEIEDAKLAVAKAIRDHEKALYDEAAAIRDVAKAQLEEARAIDAVAEAQRKLNAARKVKGLTPAAIAKVDTAVAGVLAAANAVVAGVGTATATSATASTAGMSARLMAERGGMYAFANGGIVTKAMIGLVGEAGPEAIIPLSKLNDTSGTTINISVNAGMGADGGAVGNAVVDALVKYQRRNGAIPIAVRG